MPNGIVDAAAFCLHFQPYVNSESVASMSVMDSQREIAVGKQERGFVEDIPCWLARDHRVAKHHFVSQSMSTIAQQDHEGTQ